MTTYNIISIDMNANFSGVDFKDRVKMNDYLDWLVFTWRAKHNTGTIILKVDSEVVTVLRFRDGIMRFTHDY